MSSQPARIIVKVYIDMSNLNVYIRYNIKKIT